MKRACERWVQVVASFCAAVTLHSLFMTVVELAPDWPWNVRVHASPPEKHRVDLRISPPRGRYPGRRPVVPPPQPPPEPKVSDPKTRPPGLFSLRGVKRSADLGDDGKAIDAALAWLDRHQLPDGGWSATEECRFRTCPAGRSGSSHPGATSMALLAYLADGITYLDRTTYREPQSSRWMHRGDSVKGALKWLIGQASAHGGRLPPWPPCDQALATLALVEAFALTRTELIRPSAQAMLDALLAKYAWGIRWRTVSDYAVRDAEAAAWALMAVSVAREAGLKVPADPMPDAVTTLLVDESMSPLLRASMATACRPGMPNTSWANAWMRAFRVVQQEAQHPEAPDLATLHWTLLAAHQASNSHPSTWREWRDAGVTRVVDAQRPYTSACVDGSWDPPEDHRPGRAGWTARNALTLLTWKRYAPAK